MAFSQDESTYKEHARRIPRPSHNFVPEYQMSGVPHVQTISLPANNGNANIAAAIDSYKITFYHVTRWIEVTNMGASSLRIYFNKTAAQDIHKVGNAEDKHYYLLGATSTTSRLEVKCKEMYLIADTNNTALVASVVAGLTNVMAEDFPDQTRANGFLGVEDA